MIVGTAATKPEVRWRCESCGELHGFEDDAYECCRPAISERFICPECGDDFRTADSALDCLTAHQADDDADAPIHLVTAAELEAAGQMRLVP